MEVSKLLLSSHPTTCHLDPIPSHLLQAISPALLPALTHIINTSLFTGIFPTAFKQARVTPLLKKTYIKHFSFRKLQTCLSPSIHSQNTRTSCLQPGLNCFFHRTTNWTLNSQVSGVAIQLRLCYSRSLSPADCKSRFQIISPHSAGSVGRFWHCQSSDPPVHPLITGHHWDSTSLVWILSHWSVFQGGLGREGIQST